MSVFNFVQIKEKSLIAGKLPNYFVINVVSGENTLRYIPEIRKVVCGNIDGECIILGK